MGHKVHPTIYRTQVIYTWDSKWFSKDHYQEYLEQDIRIREYLRKKFRDAHIDAVSIERSTKQMTVIIFAAKPGVIIGRGGQGLTTVRQHIERKVLRLQMKVKVNVQEVRVAALSATIVAETLSMEIERRLPFRRVMKQCIERVRKAGAQGVKVRMSGRLNGVEIARTETLASGKVPLITLRSDVDYALTEAQTIYGKIGIKVWIYKGEIFGRKEKTISVSEDGKREERRTGSYRKSRSSKLDTVMEGVRSEGSKVKS